MYKPRPYQQKAIDYGVRYFEIDTNTNPIMILGTGTGKSIIIAGIANRIHDDLLIFQPRKEILEQNYEKYTSYGNEASIYSASAGSKEIGRVTFATIGTAIKNPEMFSHFKYIIVDECHYVNAESGMYRDFFKQINAKILGLTATPYRMHQNSYGVMLRFLTRTKIKIFNEVLYYTQNKDMFEQGYLSPLKFYPIKVIDETKLIINSTRQDYTDSSLITHYEDIDFKNKLLEIVNRLIKAGRKSILVFTRFVEEAEYCASKIPNSACVSGTTKKKDRERIVSGFKLGDIRVVFNAMVFVVGFDYPSLDTVVLGRDTRSLALYYQIVGRAVRPYPDKVAWVVDLGGSYKRFGHPYNLRIGLDRKGRPSVFSGRKQLTNVYMD